MGQCGQVDYLKPFCHGEIQDCNFIPATLSLSGKTVFMEPVARGKIVEDNSSSRNRESK